MIKTMTFSENIHTAIWGCESWEISAHSSSPSVIADGEYAGKTLLEVMPDFPLLMKVIDAKTRLSVQVHPSERTAPITGGEPKTEMWCALSDGSIYAGLKKGVSSDDVRKAVESGDFESLLVRHQIKKYDTFYIPGGLVHAIGDGVKLYEVQQSSNTTYRLYDWGRVGPDGKARELHIDESLKSIDFSLPVPEPAKSVQCPFFNFRMEDVTSPKTFSAVGEKFVALYIVESGKSVLLTKNETYTVTVPGKVFVTTL